jgi:hypothetical protein
MCQLFISKDFETSLLTPLGVSLVLWRRKADNEHSNPLFYGPSPLNSQHLHFQFTIASLLKFFIRSRRDWEKKCREGSRQTALLFYSQKVVFYLVLMLNQKSFFVADPTLYILPLTRMYKDVLLRIYFS